MRLFSVEMKRSTFPLFMLLLLVLAACSSAPGVLVGNPASVRATGDATSIDKNSASDVSADSTNDDNVPQSGTTVALQLDASPSSISPEIATPTLTATEQPESPPELPTSIVTATSTPIPTATQPLAPDAWKELPVIPTLSKTVHQIYQRGIEMGNNRNAFSKIGDCGGTPAWFLGDFDRGEKYYSLGDYQELAGVIEYYQGSYERTSLAAKSSFNASSVFTQIWANREYCQPEETPLACEYRTHRPILGIIALGTNDVYHPEKFEPQMRRIIETSIENGIIPVLATKADNLEGDGSINHTIAHLALEYDIPLWNFWRAVQPLPDLGLQEDGAHLTWARNWFDNPRAMKSGWAVRNLTALQVLDAIWRGLGETPMGEQ